MSLNYDAHTEQKKFHKAFRKYKYRLCSCGTGAGKTLCGCFEDILWAYWFPGSVGFIFEPTYPMIKRILIPTLESDWLLGKPLKSHPYIKDFHRGDFRLDFNNGSVLWFVSLEDPEKAEGPNIDFAHVDEARLVRKFDIALRVIQRRLRGSNPSRGYPQGLWITTTPDVPKSVLHQKFEDPKTKLENSQVFRWSIYDNPYLPKSYIQDIEESHSGGLAERFIYGRFALIGGGSFPFDQTIHVIKEARMEHLHDFRVGVDFGWTNPSSLELVGYDGDGRVYVLDEIYNKQMTAEDIIQAGKQISKQIDRGMPFICDPSEPETIEKMKRAGLNAKPYKHKRADGLRELGARFKVAGDKRPRIYILQKCVNLISELMEYSIDVKENDHAVDALRYSLRLKKTSSVDAFRFG